MATSESQDQLYFALQTFTEVNRIITSSHNSDETLSRTAEMIANRINVDACSIYIYDSDREVLILKATHGLDASRLGECPLQVQNTVSSEIPAAARCAVRRLQQAEAVDMANGALLGYLRCQQLRRRLVDRSDDVAPVCFAVHAQQRSDVLNAVEGITEPICFGAAPCRSQRVVLEVD